MNLNNRLKISLFMLLTALSYLSCKVTERNRPIATPPGFDWQGHRGCRGLMPENSLPAFLHALEYPAVTTLELDLAVSKDNQLIVSHEPWFNASICLLPNGDSIKSADAEKQLIYEKTVAEIRDFDCGSRGNPRFKDQQKQRVYKPTLREVVEAVRQYYPNKKIQWNIEIKSEPAYDGVKTPPIERFVALVVKEIKALGIDQSCSIQSFDIRPLQFLHRTAADIKLAYLIENTQTFEQNIKVLGFVPQIYSPYYLFVDKKLVNACHDKGMQLIPWTVNDVMAMRQLIRLGVDGIITDYPNRIKEVGAL